MMTERGTDPLYCESTPIYRSVGCVNNMYLLSASETKRIDRRTFQTAPSASKASVGISGLPAGESASRRWMGLMPSLVFQAMIPVCYMRRAICHESPKTGLPVLQTHNRVHSHILYSPRSTATHSGSFWNVPAYIG
jgi:hypothetical protein